MKRKLTFLLTAILLLTGTSLLAQIRAEVTDVLTRESTGVTGTTYASWENVTSYSTAVYAGQSAGGNNSIQLRSNNSNSGIITTSSGGTITYVEITWNSNTAVGRTLNVYGSNTAYTSPTELYNASTQGTLLGTIVCGTSTELDITDAYTYIGLRSASGAMYIEEIDITWTTGGSTPNPSIAADNVEIEYNATSGSIAYTINNPVSGGVLTANTTSDWLTLGTVGSNVPFTCSTNDLPAARTASVTLTYTYNTNQTVTKSVTVTQSGNPSVINNISDITAAGNYTVQGTIVAKSSRGFIVGDGTGYIYYYNTSYPQSSYAIGDMVRLSGSVVAYGGVFEFNNSTTVTTATTSNYVVEEPTIITGAEMDSRVASNNPTQLSTYVQYVGTLTVSGTYYNITNIEGATTAKGSISYPLDTEFTALNGQEVVVKGYFVGISSSQYYNTMLGTIEANTVLNPQLTISTTSLTDFRYIVGNGPSTAKNFTVSGNDLAGDVILTAPQNYELSHSPSNGYFDNETLSPVNGTLSETTVYVRLKAGLGVGDYNGNLTITCGTLSQSIALNGQVNAQLVAAAPTFTPTPGNYIVAQTVSVSSTTDGATIYYTTDGSTPTESSTEYTQPITVSSTTTIKAIAVAPGYQNSSVAEATYNINDPITIAEARALANNEYACVEGTVIFIDGRNVYIQDATAGIDLYLNSNTVPSTLALGDNVRAYGKKTIYNGLVELTSIAGNNANVFSIISSGNSLPLATKTIAEINTDYSGSNLLQATRVKIENAVIGAINPSGTTVISQEGESMNVYHIPTIAGMNQGDRITITGVIGCYNAPQLLVNSADDIQFAHRPTITANPTSLNGFTYAYDNGGPSEIANFNLSGHNLLDEVRVYPSESFEVSTFAEDIFSPENPATVFNQGHFSDIKIYVRMKANLDGGTYSEQLYAVSQDADTIFINVTGTVTGGQQPPEPPTPPTPGDGNYVRISDLSNLTAGSYVIFAARFDGNASDYYAMSNQSSGKPTGVLFTSATVDENEVLPASIVDEEGNYYWTVGVTANGYTFTNASNELIGYNSSTNFATGGDNTEWSIELGTSGDEAMVPGYTGYVITNVNNEVRHFALNNNHNFGPYHTNNINNSGYNFYLDLFVKTEGGDPPTPTVATPTFTPAAGTYYEAQTVSIACATEGATIHYTLDGSDPTESSAIYATPLTINATTTIKAIAMKEGYIDSNIAEATYTIQMGFVTVFNQDWEGEMNGWTFVDVEGAATWSIAQTSGNHYAKINAYNQGANIDWCISPAFNLNAYANPSLSFRTAKNYTGNDLEVYFSNDYDGEDPTNATWQLLVCPLSSGGWTWVESGDINLSSFSGSECYIGFKYTCEESSAAGWEVDDIVLIGQTSSPVVTVAPLALTGFTYIEGNGPSTEQSFTVSGLNLSGNITISNAAHYEISLTSGTNFNAQSTITLTPVAGNIEETTIYVRLIAGLAVGNYNDEDITVSCSDVDDIDVNCSGSVSEQSMPGGDYVRISGASQLVAGNRVILAARYNETSNAYFAIANTLTSGKLGVTEFTSTMNGGDELIPADIMADEDSYYWTVGITSDGYTFTNANEQVLSYSSGTNFNFTGSSTAWTIETGTSDPASLVPDYFGFNIINATTTNRGMALRVTTDNSVVGAYSISNLNNGEYNFFLDIFMQGEGGVPPTPTVAAPTFTPGAGTYYATQDVVISCTTDGATIYYSLVSENGPWNEYEEAVTVDENMTIWAYAEKTGYNNSPVVSAEYVIMNDIVIIFNQDWEDDWHGWTEYCESGDSLWRIASYQGNHYAYANGYNHEPTVDWLISPAFDLDSHSDVVLTFRTAQNYTGPNLELYFSNDYDGQDPTLATWQELEFEASQGGWNWVESGDISLDEFNGTNCYIAYKYTSIDEAAGWEVDDILLVSGGATPTPTLTATPNTINSLDYTEGEGPSDSQTYTLNGANLEGEGNITVTASESFEISLDDEDFFETLEIPFANGIITDQPVTIYVRLVEGLEIGSYEGDITHEGGNASTVVNVAGTVHSENEPIMALLMPLYIQGNNGSNNNRVPMAAPVQFANLEPNATYRYTNQFIDGNDGPETAGAGNVIYANPDGFYRSTSPSLATEGGYGEFTTNEEGRALVWLMNEPTANTRFTPGNQVYMRVRLNDGNDGTTVNQVFTSEDYATVLNFGTENDEYSGSAFYVKSNEAPMSFALMYSDFNELRPAYATSIETIGVDFGNINQYADFYKDLVAGNDGWFGGILPNDNETGIIGIVTSSMDFLTINEYVSEDGQWFPEANTVNPTNGLDEPIFIDLTDNGVEEPVATNVNVWSTNNAFVIENGDECRYTMNVVNLLGQTLMTQEIAAGSTMRVNHNLTAGIYIINLQNNQNKVAVKVIVK